MQGGGDMGYMVGMKHLSMLNIRKEEFDLCCKH